MSLFKIRLKTVKRMVKENIYGRKVFYRIDPSLAEKPKEGGASKKVLHAQKHFP